MKVTSKDSYQIARLNCLSVECMYCIWSSGSFPKATILPLDSPISHPFRTSWVNSGYLHPIYPPIANSDRLITVEQLAGILPSHSFLSSFSSRSRSSAWVIHSKYPLKSSSICCFSRSFLKSPRALAFSLSFVNSLARTWLSRLVLTASYTNNSNLTHTHPAPTLYNDNKDTQASWGYVSKNCFW